MVRRRHPAGAYQRDTHLLSPIDYGQPSDRLYSSEMDLEAVTVVDLGQGSVTDGAINDGGLDGGTSITDGTLPAAAFDTTPPPTPVFREDPTSAITLGQDGTPTVAIRAVVGYDFVGPDQSMSAVAGTPNELPGSAPYTTGQRFHPTVDGRITGIRYWANAVTGTVNVALWTDDGVTKLAGASEVLDGSYTGWREVLFASPVDVLAGTIYRAAHAIPAGQPFTHNYATLTSAVADLVADGPGVYGGGFDVFPNATGDGWYWSDVVFRVPVESALDDLASFVLESTRFALPSDATQPDWSRASQWSVLSADATGVLDTVIVQPGVAAASTYWLRVAAGDLLGNWSDFSPFFVLTTEGDDDGPPQPTDVVAAAGMSVIGVRWSANPAEDWAYVEVQWRQTLPAVGNWVGAQVAGTVFVIVGLTNSTPELPVAYEVRLRSVDRSGNTLHSDGVSHKVADAASAGKGWVSPVPATVAPSALPGSALVWDEAILNSVFAGKVNADWIATGTLTVGGGADMAAAITVVDSEGQTIGLWDEDGITLLDPPRVGPPAYAGNPTYKMTLDERGLFVWDMSDAAHPVKVVSITPLGIDAASITFGQARGGHNLIPNSSFELGAFNQSVDTPNKWDVAADFNTTRVSGDTNVTTGATTLTMTAVT